MGGADRGGSKPARAQTQAEGKKVTSTDKKKTSEEKAVRRPAAKGGKAAKAAKAPKKKAAKKTAAKKTAAAKKSVKPKKTAAKKTTKAAKKTTAAKKTRAKKKTAKKAAKAKPAPKAKTAPAKKPTRRRAARKVEPAESEREVIVVEPQGRIGEAEPHAAKINNTVIAVRSSKYEVTPPDRIVEPTYPEEHVTELPEQYEETRLVLMVRDPQWIFLYWEIGPKDREMLNLAPEKLREALVVRLHDVTGIEEFNGINSHTWYEIPIRGDALSWYVHVPHSDREWCAELGVLNEEGEFIQICRSNKVHTPRDFIAEETDTEWMAIAEELAELLARSADLGLSSTLGSEAAIRQISRRFKIALEKEMASGALSGSIRKRPRPAAAGRDDELPLSVRTELIVSGTTDPSAVLTVGGERVELRPDGSFSLRFELPDGERTIPIRAESSDGSRSREILPKIIKKTD